MADGADRPDTITFTLDGREIVAGPGETIWQIAKRSGTTIPHLCHKDAPGYRPDGNCRACMVEIEGERVLAASYIRTPSEGMVVQTANDRAVRARMEQELVPVVEELKDGLDVVVAVVATAEHAEEEVELGGRRPGRRPPPGASN